MKITLFVPLQIVDGKNPLTELLEIIILASSFFICVADPQVLLILPSLPPVTQSCFFNVAHCEFVQVFEKFASIGLSRIFLFLIFACRGWSKSS